MSERHRTEPDDRGEHVTSSDQQPAPAPTDPPVEALMGLRDFLAVAPRHDSAAVTVAAQSALQRWMRSQGHDINGFYTMAQWQEYYAATMRST